MPDWISFSKIRGSWAQVGNDLPIGITNPADIIQAGGTIQVNDTEQRGDLKPEISNSIEFGTEWRFFSSRLGIDFTWYQTDTKNQLLRMPNPAGSLLHTAMSMPENPEQRVRTDSRCHTSYE